MKVKGQRFTKVWPIGQNICKVVIESFTMPKTDRHLLRQKVRQKSQK